MRHDRVVASQLLFPRTVELDDEPTIYTKGTNENLHKIHCVLDDFCEVSGAKLNWGKTVGFWRSHAPLPSWSPHVNFMWVPQGSSDRYLGCQIGLDLSMDQLVANPQEKVAILEY